MVLLYTRPSRVEKSSPPKKHRYRSSLPSTMSHHISRVICSSRRSGSDARMFLS